jgi:4'-phosphopantetheinyl transferase
VHHPHALRGALVGRDATSLLAHDEVARAARLRRLEDRVRWVAARAFTRLVLGHHRDVPAGAIAFTDGEHGKPRLAGSAALQFNVSHCAELVLVAVTIVGDVGVDVERTRTDIDAVALARTAFGDEQAARLAQLEPAARSAEFIRTWVRHEAAVKCRGTGLRAPVAGPPVGPPEGLWTADLDVAPEHAAAVAVALPRAPDGHLTSTPHVRLTHGVPSPVG